MAGRLDAVGPPVGHHAADLVDGGGEGAQPHLLRVSDHLGARLLPLLRHHLVFVRVDEEIE